MLTLKNTKIVCFLKMQQTFPINFYKKTSLKKKIKQINSNGRLEQKLGTISFFIVNYTIY